MLDQYTRTRAQLGTPALDVLRRAHVAVFGIGGVGGQAVEVLARSGVGELSLFDSDTVALSNLNRQLVALHSTLGQYKVDAMAARIADIDPTIIVHANRMFYNAETAPDVDLTQFDYVLDCIDTVSAKLLLIRCCKKDGVPILCSMGAANKLDPTAFRVADIEKTTVDPLAKVIRLECRKRRLGKVKVVFSEEQTLPPLQEEIEEAPTAARRTVPASNAFVPAACGLVCGSELVIDLLEQHGAGVLLGHSGDGFQFFGLAQLELLQLVQAGLHGLTAALEVLLLALHLGGALVEGLLLLVDAALLAGDLGAAVLDFLVRVALELEGFVLRFDDGFLALLLGSLDGIIHDALGFLLSAADLRLGGALAVFTAEVKTKRPGNSGSNKDQHHGQNW